MADEPEPEYLPEDTDLLAHFLACDPVNHGTAGTIYRAFAGRHYYIVIDTRRARTAELAGLVGMGRLLALRFASRDARESWLIEVLQSARVKMSWLSETRNRSSGGGGAPLQPGLWPPVPGRKAFDA